VGLIPDSEILRCKGPPVLDEEERLTLVQAVKWVDQVITGAIHGGRIMEQWHNLHQHHQQVVTAH
jgi:ethanolamine-phosphate cytidylyltransferase